MVPTWAKCLIVSVLGLLSYALMMAGEYGRQNFELNVCTTNTTGVDVCIWDSAYDASVAEGSAAVGSIFAAALLANALPGIPFGRMQDAFVPFHFFMVLVWYFFAWAFTIVPGVYTAYLMNAEANHTGENLVQQSPSDLLVSLESPDGSPYNPCNPSNLYCPSISPGLLAGFGFLFLGATVLWVGWEIMDHTAKGILAKDSDAEEEMEGAYFGSAVGAM